MRATRLLLASASLFGRAARVFEALAAGTLTRSQLREGIAADWGDFRQDRDEVVRGLFEWEERLLNRTLPASGDLLLIGCGTGREVMALAARGYRVTGIDPSSEALAAANRFLAERQLTAHLIEGFFEDTTITGPFDAVVFSHRTYGLIQGRRFRVKALSKAAGLIRSDGPIVLSYLLGPGMHPVRRAAAVASARLMRNELLVEAGDQFFARPAGGFGYEHEFGAGELASEATEAGLAILYQSDGSCPGVILKSADREIR